MFGYEYNGVLFTGFTDVGDLRMDYLEALASALSYSAEQHQQPWRTEHPLPARSHTLSVSANSEEVNMPVGVLKDRVTACHVCTNTSVPVTIQSNLRRHKNGRGHICKASNTPKQNRTKVKR